VMKDLCQAMGRFFAGAIPSKREVVCRIDGHLGTDLNPVDAAWDALLRRVNAKPNVVTTAPSAPLLELRRSNPSAWRPRQGPVEPRGRKHEPSKFASAARAIV
jgi:hypothetical protein